jgi:hypothetical protein
MAEIVQQRIVEAPPHEFVRLLRTPQAWLEAAAADAGAGGQVVDAKLRGELGRGRLAVDVAKRVHFQTGPVQRVGERFVVPVTWEASGFAGLFPIMDAILELHPAEENRTRLLFWGRYDPPLGRVGDLVDRFIAHRTAEATVSALLDAVAEKATAVMAASGQQRNDG